MAALDLNLKMGIHSRRGRYILVNGMTNQIRKRAMVSKSGQMDPNSRDSGNKTRL
jgi:hypothetical protein